MNIGELVNNAEFDLVKPEHLEIVKARISDIYGIDVPQAALFVKCDIEGNVEEAFGYDGDLADVGEKAIDLLAGHEKRRT